MSISACCWLLSGPLTQGGSEPEEAEESGSCGKKKKSRLGVGIGSFFPTWSATALKWIGAGLGCRTAESAFDVAISRQIERSRRLKGGKWLLGNQYGLLPGKRGILLLLG